MRSDSSMVGAMPPPPGVVSNFNDPESIAHRVIVVSVLGAVITIPICLVRLYTKHRILRNFGWDDYSIMLATTFALGFSVYVCYQTTNCLGIHIWDCPADKFYALMKIGDIAGPILSNFATMLTKVSLCLFYLRVSPFKASFRLTVYLVMCVSVVNGMLNALGFAWVCQPIEKYWDFSITTGDCINLNSYFLATACINAATGLVLLVLPVFILHKLQLPLRRKIGAALLLMTASFVCVVSLIRVEQVVHGMKIVPTDATWGLVANFIWLLVEMWLGIVCTCLPIIYTFVRTQILSKRERGPSGAFIAVRDPNSGQILGLPTVDSGYYTGNATVVSLEQLDVERPIQIANPEHSIRAATSNKSLLQATVRCDD
ncbi:uncharacterized protein EKO05_0009855 [Ascochyta rabiei]|uniref:uncharacterized protein n=1 Tax=Didymella rabiei TaxID=5454 RepID=UPI0021FA98B5|nr:uncharacterized protein EKO05_0009855 [Ascochyta rabiei]UPX19597.1 hypothetical protein EKO05_0009855 [Ascochyta rabiei]